MHVSLCQSMCVRVSVSAFRSASASGSVSVWVGAQRAECVYKVFPLVSFHSQLGRECVF